MGFAYFYFTRLGGAFVVKVQIYQGFEGIFLVRKLSEFIYMKEIEAIIGGLLVVKNLKVEVGNMDFGFKINGILGMDFLFIPRLLRNF